MMVFAWLKVLHLLAVISWMAGLFYLPRLFVYHRDVAVGSEPDGIFKVMERRLMIAIMRPACLVALLAGGALVSAGGFSWGLHWLWLKILGVVVMLIYHGVLEMHLEQFARGGRPGDAGYFRILNEVPTVVLIWIVVMVVVKPF